MKREQIINRCVLKLGMTRQEAEWVADNYSKYFVPNWSSWSWVRIDKMLKNTRIYMR